MASIDVLCDVLEAAFGAEAGVEAGKDLYSAPPPLQLPEPALDALHGLLAADVRLQNLVRGGVCGCRTRFRASFRQVSAFSAAETCGGRVWPSWRSAAACEAPCTRLTLPITLCALMLPHSLPLCVCFCVSMCIVVSCCVFLCL